MRSGTFRAEVDLTGATAGAHEYPVNVTASDPRIRIVDVSPPRITVRLDENIDQPVPVRVVRTGNVPFGYQAGDPQVDPGTVTVSGPASFNSAFTISPTGGVAGVVRHGIDGFVEADPAALLNRMQELAADRQRAALLGEAARTHATARFGLERFVAEWNRLFAALTHGTGERRAA
jgi:hypothetical protein